MIMKKHVAIFALCVSISLISIPVCGGDAYFSKTYPLPITEMQDIISKWLGHWDFKISPSDQGYSQLSFIAESHEEVWEVDLSQQSPLATKVTIRKQSGDIIKSNRLTHWEDYISKYLNSSDNEIQDDQNTFFSDNQDQPKRLDNHNSTYDKVPDDKTPDINQDIPNALSLNRNSVVCIKARVAGEVYQASGFVINKNGLIVCTAHDFKGLEEVRIILYDGKEIPGRILRMDFQRDLTLIQVDEKLEGYIPLLNGRERLKKGEKLFSMGCPVNQDIIVYPGFFTAGRHLNNFILWQVRMQIHHGQSGSPVFDENGNLVGIVTGRHRGIHSVGFLIPFGTLLEFVQEK
jgi:serine protease Do